MFDPFLTALPRTSGDHQPIRSGTITNLRAGPSPNTPTDPWRVGCGGCAISGITCSTWFYPDRNAFGCQLISAPNFFDLWMIYHIIYHYLPLEKRPLSIAKQYDSCFSSSSRVSWEPAVIFGFGHGHQAQKAPEPTHLGQSCSSEMKIRYSQHIGSYESYEIL